MKLINIDNLSKTYHTKNDEINSIDNLSFSIEKSEVLSLIGPSGCGKSTLLNILTELESPSSGKIKKHDDLVIGYMMQNDALLPWLTVKENALLGLRLKGLATKENIDYTLDLIDKYGLKKFINSYPDNLSGGMRQRVALIRTLAIKPNILLLDEPFSKLDIDSRLSISDDVNKIIKELKITTVLISHDIAEVLSLSDRIIILSKRPTKIKCIIDLKNFSDDLPSNRRKNEMFNRLYNLLWEECDHER